MPVLLDAAGLARWLDVAGRDDVAAAALTKPCPNEWLTMVPVSPRVNKVANDDASNIVPIAGEAPFPAGRATASLDDATRSRDADGQGSLF